MWQLFTAEQGPAPLDLAGWFQTGGFFALSAVLLWFALTAYRRETSRGDRLEGRLDEVQKYVRDTVLPTMADSTDALREATEALREREARSRRHDNGR
jgi:hypothetical protein